jgi:hypothetical protein
MTFKLNRLQALAASASSKDPTAFSSRMIEMKR